MTLKSFFPTGVLNFISSAMDTSSTLWSGRGKFPCMVIGSSQSNAEKGSSGNPGGYRHGRKDPSADEK